MTRRQIAAGTVVHLAVTLWPWLLAPAGRVETLVLFALGATALFLGDATAPGGVRLQTPTAADRRALGLARAGSLTMLLAFWVGLASGERVAVTGAWWGPWLGLAFMLGGAGLRHVAIRTLGPYFVTEVTPGSGHHLVRSGIYARLRHPSEIGLGAAMLGAALVLDSAATLAATIALAVPLAYARIRLEEAELARVHPDAARAAAARS
jgi:protein-S-isoprenylcysteine O-methyltransferase Ste14